MQMPFHADCMQFGKDNQQLVFLIVTCEKQIALTLLIIFECVPLLFQHCYTEHHMLEVGFF